MRRAAKVDDNQSEIVATLRYVGCSVTSLASLGRGCPDIVVGYNGVNFLFEIKDGKKCPSRRKLTPEEKKWHESWKGQVAVVESVEDALRFVSGHAV